MREIGYASKAQVKEAATLRVKKFRRKAGLFLVEGITVIREALESGWEMERVFVNAERKKDEEIWRFVSEMKGAPPAVGVFLTHERDIKRLSDTVNPAAAVGVFRAREAGLADLKREGPLALAVLGAVQDPGNAGAIIRSADAFGLAGVILSRGSVEWQNSKVVRSAAGSCFHLPVVSDAEIGAVMAWMKENGVAVLAAVSRGGEDPTRIKLPERWAVVLGNETAGPPAEAVDGCDARISIPLTGRAESLNVAVSAGIIFHALRGR